MRLGPVLLCKLPRFVRLQSGSLMNASVKLMWTYAKPMMNLCRVYCITDFAVWNLKDLDLAGIDSSLM